jgi:alpha-glucosidase
MLLLTLRGTPTLYYGDEIGMHDVGIPPERVQDPVERNVPGLGLGRDPQRTPMQWSAEPQAGFSTGEPWLPLAPDYREVNVAVQRDASDSMLRLYRALIALRRSEPALEVGRFELVQTEGDLLAYVRRGRREEREFLVALNLVADPRSLAFAARGAVALSTHLDRGQEPLAGEVRLRPDEGVIIRLAGRAT